MTKDLREWSRHVAASADATDALMATLEGFGAIVERIKSRAANQLEYSAKFPAGETTVTVKIIMLDSQTDSDIVIANITVLPEADTGKGYGGEAIRRILAWAGQRRMNEVRATQVGNPQARKFWEKNGFLLAPEPNPCKDLVHRLL